MAAPQGRSAWLLLAIASGACAAFNGVFAKLTTTELTTSWASAISGILGLDPSNRVVELGIRGLFFALNLVFNGIMWGLFTKALTLATSTVRVSIINTSANFMITAILGAMIFSERLPGLWWLGASLLVAGSVIIGRREEAEKVGAAGTAGTEPLVGTGEGAAPGELYADDASVESGSDYGRKRKDSDNVELDTLADSDREDGE